MNSSINLVSSRNQALEREQKVLLMLRSVAVFLLITIAGISVLAFIITTQIPLSQIKNEEASTLQGISALSKKLTNYYLLKDRVSNVNKLLIIRKNYTEALAAVFDNVGEDLTIDSLIVEEGKLEIEISGKSLVPINEAINSIIGLGADGRRFKNLKLKSLSLNTQAGRYSVSLEAQIL